MWAYVKIHLTWNQTTTIAKQYQCSITSPSEFLHHASFENQGTNLEPKYVSLSIPKPMFSTDVAGIYPRLPSNGEVQFGFGAECHLFSSTIRRTELSGYSQFSVASNVDVESSPPSETKHTL